MDSTWGTLSIRVDSNQLLEWWQQTVLAAPQQNEQSQEAKNYNPASSEVGKNFRVNVLLMDTKGCILRMDEICFAPVEMSGLSTSVHRASSIPPRAEFSHLTFVCPQNKTKTTHRHV